MLLFSFFLYLKLWNVSDYIVVCGGLNLLLKFDIVNVFVLGTGTIIGLKLQVTQTEKANFMIYFSVWILLFLFASLCRGCIEDPPVPIWLYWISEDSSGYYFSEFQGSLKAVNFL